MILRTFISFLILFFVTSLMGQARTLTGRIVDDKFEPFMQVMIFNVDTVLFGKSDMDGNFSITVPAGTKTLLLASVGMEWKKLDLSDSCSNLEIILLPSWTHCFKTPKKAERLRKKEFNKLPTLHKTAFKKGVFKSERPCYVDNFISY
jgi:hypothetical protein